MAREPAAIADLRRTLGAQLAAFRQAAGLTQAQLARVTFCDRSRIAHLEKSRIRTDERFWRAADDACRAGGALLAAFLRLQEVKSQHEQQECEQHLAAMRALTAELDLAAKTSELSDGADSRAAGEELVVMAARESSRFGRRHGGSGVHVAALEQLEEDTRRLSQEFLSDRPLDVVVRLRELRDDLFVMLERPGSWPQHQRRLYAMAARSCGLLAVASSDFYGRYDAAADQCRAAWQCSELADQPELRSWTRSLQSGIEFWAGRWDKAAELADQALTLASTRSGLARAASMKARALARLGDRTGVSKVVALSQRDERDSVADDEVGVVLFPEINRLRCVGTAHLWIGDHRTARTYLSQALHGYERSRAVDYAVIAVTRLDLASAYLAAGDLDEAADVVRPLALMETDRRLEGAHRRARELQTVLRSDRYAGTPQARALLDDLAGFATQHDSQATQ